MGQPLAQALSATGFARHRWRSIIDLPE